MKSAVFFSLSLLLPLSGFAQKCDYKQADKVPVYRYLPQTGGLVLDKETGLLWQRCAEGQKWTGNTCSGKASELTLAQARATATQKGNGLRLPSRDELLSLVNPRCSEPAINQSVFPATPAEPFWSNSQEPSVVNNNWTVHFGDGYDEALYREQAHHVRLVKNGGIKPTAMK